MNQKMIDLVVMHSLPLNMFDYKEFREIFDHLHPHYKMPSRKSIHSLLEREYKSTKSFVKSLLKRNDRCSIKVDFWSSNSFSFLGVMLQFIDNAWNLRTLMLGLRICQLKHTSNNIYLQKLIKC